MSTVHLLAPEFGAPQLVDPAIESVVDPYARHPARLPAPLDADLDPDPGSDEPDLEAVVVHGDRGQTTAEYALVLVGAATIAMLVVAWAGSTSRISALFDAVLRSVQGLLA